MYQLEECIVKEWFKLPPTPDDVDNEIAPEFSKEVKGKFVFDQEALERAIRGRAKTMYQCPLCKSRTEAIYITPYGHMCKACLDKTPEETLKFWKSRKLIRVTGTESH